MSNAQRITRCAIYTRKSSEEGLEQEFNSLDAQREACSAYVTSQKQEGWKLLSTPYDDGGFSGGSLERPALDRLLQDIDTGRIDMVVVYKIDRLTRSLMDFAKLVDRLDRSNCSFVSVTQAFNTSTSMGRLTLNVLLSFAQFEREVTAERIRDKISASKKKGMWMGGIPPLGYVARDRQLIVNPQEARTVRQLFDLYLEHRCISAVKMKADALGLRSRPTRNGNRALLSRGRIHALLTNPIYIGEVRHKSRRYPGRHEAIIETDAWEDVQTSLGAQAQGRARGSQGTAPRSPLVGRITDETGDRLTPTYAKKGSRRFRYYVSRRLIDRSRKGTTASGWRLPADQVEQAVAAAIASRCRRAADTAELASSGDDVESIQRVRARLETVASGETREQLRLVAGVTIAPGRMEITLDRQSVADKLETVAAALPDTFMKLEEQFRIRRRGVEARLVIGEEPPKIDQTLLRYVARGHRWWGEILKGKPLASIASAEGVSPSLIARHLDAAFLAPQLLEAIVDGTQPASLTVMALRQCKLPMSWKEQIAMFRDGETATSRLESGVA